MKSSTYTCWVAAKSRCENPNNSGYKKYGARGIKFCKRWKGEDGFDHFIQDMGEKPTPAHSIERINNDGNYTPANCRWATNIEQARNRRNTIAFAFNGKSLPLVEIASLLNISYTTLYMRIFYLGWSFKRASTQKVRGKI